MTTDDLSGIKEILEEISKKNSLSRILNEEQADVSKYLTDFIKKLEEASEKLSKASASFDETRKATENRQKQDIKIYEEFKDQFLEAMKLEKAEEVQAAFDKIINSVEDAEKKLALTENSKLLLEALQAKKDFIAAKDDFAKAQLEEQKHRSMLERIKTSNQSNVNTLFKSLGLSYEGDPQNANALFLGLSLLRDGKVQEGMNLLSASAELAAKAYSNMLDPLNIFVNILGLLKSKTVEVFTMVDSVTANFLKATGASMGFRDVLMEAWDNTRGSNVSLEEMSETVQGLIDSFRGFQRETEDSKIQTAEYIALVSRLGVGSANAIKVLTYFTDSLKYSVTQSKGEFSTLLGLVETTGETLKKVTDDFTQALPVVSRYGSLANSVFRQMFATAKALRIETAQLLEVASNFDTYEDAATSVGKLNAIMGGPYLNAIQLMNQNEAERVVTLNRAFKATGRTWESLSKYSKLAYAAAANITDMDLAQRVFNGSTQDAARYMRQASLEQEELADKNQRAASIAEKWQNVLSQIGAVLTPIIDAVHAVVDVFLDFSDTLGEVWGPLRILAVPLLFMMISGFKGLFTMMLSLGPKSISKIGGLFGKLAGTAKTVADTAATAAPKIGAIGSEAAGAAPAVGGLGAALGSINGVLIAKNILFIGGAIAIVVASFMALKDIAEGIGGVFKGVGKFVEGIGQGFYDWVTESPLEELEDLIRTLSEAGPGIGDKMMKIGAGLKEMVESFNKTISQSTVESFTDLIEALADNSDKFSNTVGLGILDSYARLMEASSDLVITPTKINDMKQFTENLVQLSKTSGDGGIASIQNSSAPKIEVKVYIDGTELTEKVVKTTIAAVGNSLQPRTG